MECALPNHWLKYTTTVAGPKLNKTGLRPVSRLQSRPGFPTPWYCKVVKGRGLGIRGGLKQDLLANNQRKTKKKPGQFVISRKYNQRAGGHLGR